MSIYDNDDDDEAYLDDGYRNCDFCDKGFTLWFGLDSSIQNNGEVGDNCLCEECFKKFSLKKD